MRTLGCLALALQVQGAAAPEGGVGGNLLGLIVRSSPIAKFVLFVLVLISGGLFVALYNHEELPTKPETVLVKMKIEKSTQYA